MDRIFKGRRYWRKKYYEKARELARLKTELADERETCEGYAALLSIAMDQLGVYGELLGPTVKAGGQ